MAIGYTERREQYIVEEAANFIHAYSILKDELPKLDLTPGVVT